MQTDLDIASDAAGALCRALHTISEHANAQRELTLAAIAPQGRDYSAPIAAPRLAD